MEKFGWYGVDLDGTLAYYDGWQGPEHIGDPIPLMLHRVQEWMEIKQEVRIFTARATDPVAKAAVEQWLMKHGMDGLKVTCCKDYAMICLYDDRCVQVEENTGILLGKQR